MGLKLLLADKTHHSIAIIGMLQREHGYMCGQTAARRRLTSYLQLISDTVPVLFRSIFLNIYLIVRFILAN